jgi:ABC-2 type transport system permease protein
MGGFVFKAALQDFTRAKRMVTWLSVCVVLFLVALVYQRTQNSFEPVSTYATLSSLMVFQILPLASAIFSSAIVSAEVEQKTIVYLLTRPIPRWQLLLFRMLASVLVVFVIGALAITVVSLAVFRGLGHPQFGRDLVAAFVGAFAYGGLFTLLSLLINRSMIVSLLFAFGWETAVPRLPGDIQMLSINSYLASIANRPYFVGVENPIVNNETGLGSSSIAPTFAWFFLAIFITFCFVMSMLWFNRAEIVPREDVE